MTNYWRLYLKETGETISSAFRYHIINIAHDLMKDYQEKYNQEYYLEYLGDGLYTLLPYVVK
jgi:hypothetical protein